MNWSGRAQAAPHDQLLNEGLILVAKTQLTKSGERVTFNLGRTHLPIRANIIARLEGSAGDPEQLERWLG